MATKTWAGGTSTAWATAGNWSPSGVPAATDDVVITATGTNSPNLSSSTSINSLSFTGTKTLTLGTGAALTVTGVVPGTTFGINFTGASDVITGTGTISATNGINVATGGSATITNTGALQITGVLSEAGTGTLALSLATGSTTLTLESAGSRVTSVTINGSSRTLALAAGATLTVANVVTLGGANNLLQLDGPTSALTGLAGFNFTSTGTISGQGTVTGAVTAGTQAAHITASGGTLIMASAVTGTALILSAAAASGTLQLNGAGNTAATVTLNGGTLKLNGSTATLSVTGALAIAAGTVNLVGGASITDTANFTITTGTITGAGKVTGTVAAGANAGHITANGGVLEMASAVTGTALIMGAATPTDTLQLDGVGNTAATVTLNNATLKLNAANTTLTVTNAIAIGTGIVNLAVAGATLTDANGLSLAGGSIIGAGSIAANTNISGYGTVSIPISTAGSITASGGTLNLTGTVTTRTLAIASASASELEISGTATAAAIASFTSSNQTLQVGAAGALTLNGNQSIGTGYILMAGGTLTDTSGVTVGAGQINGFGMLSATVTAIGPAGIMATGGTLEVTGAITNGVGGALGFSIDTGSTLLLDAATTATSATFLHSTGVLEVGTGGTLTLASLLDVGANTVQLDGSSTLTDGLGVTVEDGTISGTGTIQAAVSGYGTVSAAIASGNTVTASAGNLILTQNIPATSGLAFNVADTAASILQFNGTVGGSNTVSFNGTHGAVELNHVSISPTGLGFAGTVSGLDVLSSGSLNAGVDNYINVQDKNTITKITIDDSTHIDLYSGGIDLGTITLGTALGAGTYVNFTNDALVSGTVIGSGTDIFLSDVVCFAAGTHIRTPAGERDVETLAAGDLVLTTEGEARPIAWVGRQTVSRVFGDPLRVLPIRIEAGALGENLPVRDLLVTPDHALLLGGVLIHAGALVNGTTIRREQNVPTVCTYYHVELEDHSLILAEGVAAETFVDNIDRLAFDNWEEHLARWPNGRAIDEMALPRAKSARQVPPAVRAQLAERAGLRTPTAA